MRNIPFYVIEFFVEFLKAQFPWASAFSSRLLSQYSPVNHPHGHRPIWTVTPPCRCSKTGSPRRWWVDSAAAAAAAVASWVCRCPPEARRMRQLLNQLGRQMTGNPPKRGSPVDESEGSEFSGMNPRTDSAVINDYWHRQFWVILQRNKRKFRHCGFFLFDDKLLHYTLSNQVVDRLWHSIAVNIRNSFNVKLFFPVDFMSLVRNTPEMIFVHSF